MKHKKRSSLLVCFRVKENATKATTPNPARQARYHCGLATPGKPGKKPSKTLTRVSNPVGIWKFRLSLLATLKSRLFDLKKHK